jgi:hypothetical protein
MFEIRDAERLESATSAPGTNRDALRLASDPEAIRHPICGGLSWTHYRLLMQVQDPAARQWYLAVAAGCEAIVPIMQVTSKARGGSA